MFQDQFITCDGYPFCKEVRKFAAALALIALVKYMGVVVRANDTGEDTF